MFGPITDKMYKGGNKLNLSEYLNLIYPYLAKSKNHAEFLIDYFDWCIEEDSENQINNPLASLSLDYQNRIFNGTKNISVQNSNKILSLLNRERHSEYFECNTAIDALDALENDLVKYIEVDTSLDTSDICFDALTTILTAISRKEEPEISVTPNNRMYIRNLQDLEVSVIDGKIVFKNTNLSSGEVISVPEEFSDQELRYINALFAAYSDESKTDISKENIDNSLMKYKRNFSNQRKNFFSAETVNRFVRDGFLDGEDHFLELLDETYEGISETVWSEYDNGYQRLNETLKHVSNISLNGAILAQIPQLINNKVRKGICHILVNKNRIEWVIEDE